MSKRVAVIYLCYGCEKYVPGFVDGLEKIDNKEDVKVFMVTNNSPDNIAELTRQTVLPRSKVDLPEVELIDNDTNLGFSHGNNIGIRKAIEEGFDYIFLHNGDLQLRSDSILKAVEMAESDEKIGSVQSLVLYWKEQDKVNSTGGIIHPALYAYARDNGKRLDEIVTNDGEEIAYSSGAAVLYKVDVLRKVGLLEEAFFMYHEDLELGLRIKMAGFKNVLSMQSRVIHDYEFSRNKKMFAWIELYRLMTYLSYFKFRTYFVLGPLMSFIELGTWLMAVKGGWLDKKLWAYGELLKFKTWREIFRMRREVQGLRKISDQELVKLFYGRIEAQEVESSLMSKVINPVVDGYWKFLKRLIVW